ncbi:glycosyltransferase [Photobacterium damselae]
MKRVLVSATSITSGGALNILKQFIANAPLNISFVIIVNERADIDDVFTLKSNILFVRMSEKSRLDRLKWDFWGGRKFIKNNGYYFDLVISLQNTSLNIPNIKQLIYIHQGLFLSDKNWNPFKKTERKYAFYKYIYPFFIFLFSNGKTKFVVQTEWMKNKLHQKYNQSIENIYNIKPDIVPWGNKIKKSLFIDEKIIFYPATGEIFKNHLLILRALKKSLAEYNGRINIKLVFTINVHAKDNCHIYEYLKKNSELYKYIIFLGPIPYDEIKIYYDNCHAVIFPSEIESFGLPLLEASMLGKYILSLDTNFSREVLEGYDGVKYIPKNVDDWSDNLSLISFEEERKYNNFTPSYKNNWDTFFKLI